MTGDSRRRASAECNHTLPPLPQHRIMATDMRRYAYWLLAGLAPLTAQDPVPAQPPAGAGATAPAAPPAGRQPVDWVVATVNDAAILMSELRTRAAGSVNREELNLGRRLRPAEVLTMLKAELVPIVQNHAMAQAAKTFGFATPEQVEELFQDEMRREEEEQIRDFGTLVEFSKELQLTGRTWQTYERERRVDKMRQFAEDFAVGMRMQKQGNLFLTPRMLRETYQRRIDQFVHGPRAGVILVGFEGPDARDTAAAAAALWRQEDLDGKGLLARFPTAKGTTQELGGITEKSRASLATVLADFALAGPLNHVAEPFELGGTWRTAKIALYEPAANGKFEDAEVQAELRYLCQKGVVGELRRQATARAMQRTEYWVHKDFR